jgi:hypothetical protein
MQRWLLLGFLLACTLPSSAQQLVTVSQLEHALSVARERHKSDQDLVRQLSAMRLSERLSEPSLSRLASLVVLGSQSATTLQLLADESSFLRLPAIELTDTSVPDVATRQRILKASVAYVGQMLSSLPNVLAKRVTKSYDNSTYSPKHGALPIHLGFHLIATESREISIRNDDRDASPSKNSEKKKELLGMTSWGEFGSLLAVIFNDAAKGTVSWSRWEPGASDQLAVFQFKVPKSVSHYRIVDSGRSIRPGYFGRLWIDPASGVVQRILIVVDATDKDVRAFRQVETLVQYAQIKIDTRTFFGPVRSLTLSESAYVAQTPFDSSATKWLNETTFTGYHRFGSDAQIITGTEKPEPDRKPE